MARTIQKKNNFNHGMITRELVERVDLDIFNKSAEVLFNLTPMMYGGVRSRRGTVFCDRLFFSDNSALVGTASSAIVPNVSQLQTYGATTQSGAIGTTQELFRVDYTQQVQGATFDVKGIKLDFELPVIGTEAVYTIVVNTGRASSVRPGVGGYNTRWTKTDFVIKNPGRGYRASDWTPGAITSVAVDELGRMTSVSPSRVDYALSAPNGIAVSRLGAPRSISAKIQVSADGATWKDVADIVITETAGSYSVATAETFRYARIVRNTNEELATSFTISMFIAKASFQPLTIGKIRTFGYVYNREAKYLLLLGNKNIFIYRDGKLIQQIFTSVITEDILQQIKITAKDDTIIFTHGSIPPHRLLRIGENVFSFSEFELESVPMALFGNATTEGKTTSITPSAVEGSVAITGSGFTADMVGQYIDGGGARAKVVEFISDTKLRVRTIIPFYNTDTITSWDYIHGYEPVFSAARGWPRTCLFVQQRLAFGGSRDLPANIWASRIGDYNNFENIGNYDNDAIDYPMSTNHVITNMIVQRNMHVFTSGEEQVVPEGAYTPSKFNTSKIGENGDWPDVVPVVCDGMVLGIEKNGRNLYCYGYDEGRGGFVPVSLSQYFLYEGLPLDMTLEKNSVKDKGTFVYILLDTGDMCVQALGLSENINAPCVFHTDGRILSVCAVEEDVYLVVQRERGVYVEKLADNRLDMAINTQVVNGQISNLGDYAGKRVYIEQGGRAIVKTVPDDGVLDVPTLADDTAVVGLPFTYKLRSNPIVVGGQSTAIRKRINRATVECVDTNKIQFNGQVLTGRNTYDFFAVGAYERDCRYEITGEYAPVRILSVQLDISYEG